MHIDWSRAIALRGRERSPFLRVFRAPCTMWEIAMELGGERGGGERC
jgi:hypothetical protein